MPYFMTTRNISITNRNTRKIHMYTLFYRTIRQKIPAVISVENGQILKPIYAL